MKIFLQKLELFRFLSKIDVKTNKCPAIHKIWSDDSLHMPCDSHYIHTHGIMSFFHKQWILVFEEIFKYVNASVSNKYQNEVSDLSLLLENQSVRNTFSLPFLTQSVKWGAKLLLS